MSNRQLSVTGRPVGRGNPAPEELVLGDKLAWMSHGLCIDNPDAAPDTWFAEEDEPEAQEQANKICNRCPVQLNCAKFSRETGQLYGTWGGFTALELTDLLKGARKIRRIAARKDEWSG